MKRVADVNVIYGQHVGEGLSNREIWRRYIYPSFGISERTFYNILNASVPSPQVDVDYPTLFDDYGKQ